MSKPVFKPCNQRQMMLLPPDLSDSIPEGHMARVVDAVVDFGEKVRPEEVRVVTPWEEEVPCVAERVVVGSRTVEFLTFLCTTTTSDSDLLESSNPPLNSSSLRMNAPRFSDEARCWSRRLRAASKSSGWCASSAPSSEKPGRGEVWKS